MQVGFELERNVQEEIRVAPALAKRELDGEVGAFEDAFRLFEEAFEETVKQGGRDREGRA